MESNSSEAATSNAASSTSVTGGLDMYPHQQSQASHQDFKMPSSLGEVQRIIGLSLSKIQMGRNQRGGLPLHKNLLVATVLNKARDLYMQETMYMNYKMMTGQFAAAASAASASNTNSQMEYSQHYHHHYGMGMSSNQNETDMDELEPVEANEADLQIGELQCYWVFTQLQNMDPLHQGPPAWPYWNFMWLQWVP